ncbi:MAG: hypothetical protein ACE361_24970 [Aureliella sp.]
MSRAATVFPIGPRPSRFYFSVGDHWAVAPGEPGSGVIASLELKKISRTKFFLPGCVLPALISLVAGIHFLLNGDRLTLCAALGVAIAIAGLAVFVFRNEWLELNKLSSPLFVLRNENMIELPESKFALNSIADVVFEYTFFQPGVAKGKGAFSELDLVIRDCSKTYRTNLLAQKSNWALKHARDLSRLTKVPLTRRVVGRASR